jgi:hypothetical protein
VGELQGKSRLADPAGADEGDDSGVRRQPLQLPQLVVTTREAAADEREAHIAILALSRAHRPWANRPDRRSGPCVACAPAATLRTPVHVAVRNR